MKAIFYALIIGFFSISCSNNDDTPSSSSGLSNLPEAKPEYDNSNYGIYKGVFVGSTGHVYININNNNSISAKLVIDGVTYNCTTSESVEEGSAITNLTFTTGSLGFDFNVNANGTNPTISNINVPMHPDATITLFKEHSNAQIKCYIGTFSGDLSGVFNLAIKGNNNVIGLAKPTIEDFTIALVGSISSNTITGFYTGGSFTGIINNNSISGQWENDFMESGTWVGTRTL